MSEDNNESIDKLSLEYSETDKDQRAYIKAQAATIISQTKELNILKKQLEQAKKEVERSSLELINLKASIPANSKTFETSDEETTAVIQLAMIKNLAMNRELTLEETRKYEIFCKVLKEIRGKVLETEEPTEKISDADLLAFMQGMNTAKGS